MDNYIVRPIVETNPIHQEIKWGVFDNSAKDYERIHSKDFYANLVVECKIKEHADMIAEILNKDDTKLV